MALKKVKTSVTKKEVMSVKLGKKNVRQTQWHYDLLKDDIWKEITQQVRAVTFL